MQMSSGLGVCGRQVLHKAGILFGRQHLLLQMGERMESRRMRCLGCQSGEQLAHLCGRLAVHLRDARTSATRAGAARGQRDSGYLLGPSARVHIHELVFHGSLDFSEFVLAVEHVFHRLVSRCLRICARPLRHLPGRMGIGESGRQARNAGGVKERHRHSNLGVQEPCRDVVGYRHQHVLDLGPFLRARRLPRG